MNDDGAFVPIDYPTFLAARLNDQEARLDAFEDYLVQGATRFERGDIAAKRALIADYLARDAHLDEHPIYVYDDYEWQGLKTAIKYLCRPFAGHPDYPGDPS